MRHLLTAAALCAALALPAHADPIGYRIGNGNTNTQPVDPAHPLPVAPSSAANFAPSASIPITTTATQIVTASSTSPTRGLLIVQNNSTTAVYLGPTSSVTASTGFLLPGVAGASLTIPYTGALYGVTASGTALVYEAEVY